VLECDSTGFWIGCWIYWPRTHDSWLHFTVIHAKSFPDLSVFTSSCLVTAPTMAIPLLPGSITVWKAAPFQLWIFQSQSQSYFTTYGLTPISSSWHQTPWDPRPFVKCTFRMYWMLYMLLKILRFALHPNPLSVQALQSRSWLSYLSYATTAA
jgi:hypothetical protein